MNIVNLADDYQPHDKHKPASLSSAHNIWRVPLLSKPQPSNEDDESPDPNDPDDNGELGQV